MISENVVDNEMYIQFFYKVFIFSRRVMASAADDNIGTLDFVNMADEAARRRELRRRKILENAEERKRKIFGTTNTSSSSSVSATDNNNKTISMSVLSDV